MYYTTCTCTFCATVLYGIRSCSSKAMAAKRPAPDLQREDSSLTKRFHGDEQEALVDGVYLNEQSLTQITRLFKIIDRNSDGKLDLQDFALQGTITNIHYAKWTEIRDKFDHNGDGQVTMDEFRKGFKKMVLGLGCTFIGRKLPQDLTIEGYLKQLEIHINDQVQELCKQAYIWYSSSVVL